MSDVWFELHFEGYTHIELIETRFKLTGGTAPVVAVRGKTAGAFTAAGTFQWTSAVRALCLLCVRSVVSYQIGGDGAAGTISGYRGSLAASLDYAISKQPTWLTEMCGIGADGQLNSKRLFIRSNPERKRPGPVIVGLNEIILPPTAIHVVINGEPIITQEQLQKLLSIIPIRGDDVGEPLLVSTPAVAV
jgi:hypothetical protein